MRATFTLLTMALVLLTAMPAHAGDDEPTPAELAGMILDGNEGEHALVAAWLQQSDRTLLLGVFKELRALKAKRAGKPRPTPTMRVTKDRGFRMPLPDKYRQPEKQKDTVITAELRMIDVPLKGVAAFLGEQRPTAKRRAVQLSDAQAKALLQAVDKNKDVTLVHAPRLTVYDGQQANVSVLNEISYLQDFDVEVAKDGTRAADPVVQTIQEGTVIDFKPSIAGGGKSIGLQFKGTFAAVTRPIPELEKELPGGAGKKVKVQIPELRVQRFKTTVYVPDGGWVLIGGGIQLEPKKGATVERVTLVHVKSHKLEAGVLKHEGQEIKLRPAK